MSATASPTRLILFEVGGAPYALPIEDVLEVRERGEHVAVPSLPPTVAGVINHHGEALPVIAAAALFDGVAELESSEHLLVLTARNREAGQLGLPVDRVLGLADAPLGAGATGGWIRERLALRGRVVGVLDAERTLERAEQIFQSQDRSNQGGAQ